MLSPSTIRFAALNWIIGEAVLTPMIFPPVIWIVLGVAPTKPEQLRLDFNVPFPVTVTLPSIFPSNTTARRIYRNILPDRISRTANSDLRAGSSRIHKQDII